MENLTGHVPGASRGRVLWAASGAGLAGTEREREAAVASASLWLAVS